MRNKKIRVGIIFGGKSAEHEVSLQSARNVAEAIDKNKYEVVLIGIDKSGRWYLNNDASKFLLNSNNPKLISLNKENSKLISLSPGSNRQINLDNNADEIAKIDIAFPILHGPLGEDGCIQGLLKIAGIPFVGSDVLGSAVGMDKDIMKRLLRDAGIPVCKFIVLRNGESKSFKSVVKILGLPFFVKPSNMGSSVGVSMVTKASEYSVAINEAFRYDNKILIEESISGREIECSVLGNDKPAASVPGEIIVHDNFYSYEAKYINENGATLQIPAKLTKSKIKEIQNLSIKTFKVLSCDGLGRVDFFLKENGDLLVNEINTMPGFTSISMYPKLWEASGVTYNKLIDKLIELALEKSERSKMIETERLGSA